MLEKTEEKGEVDEEKEPAKKADDDEEEEINEEEYDEEEMEEVAFHILSQPLVKFITNVQMSVSIFIKLCHGHTH